MSDLLLSQRELRAGAPGWLSQSSVWCFGLGHGLMVVRLNAALGSMLSGDSA